MNELAGKRVLLFVPYTFNYQNIICDKIKSMGAECYLYNVRSIDSAIEKALIKYNPHLFKKKTTSYFNSIIEKHCKEAFDYILFVKCDMPTCEDIKRIRKAFPSAKVCLHLWDSVKNIPHILGKVSLFDRITSFDPDDCKRYKGFILRPLFYADEFMRTEGVQDYKYDISFCGTIHSDRYKILSAIKEKCEEADLKYFGFHYLQSKFVYYIFRFCKSEFRKTTKSFFSFEKMSSAEVARVVNESRCVIDIQHPRQTGLTMRTIEMVGMNKKIITTNQDIVNYEFYRPNNVCVIDRKKPIIDSQFFSLPYERLPREIYDKYSIEAWIIEVFGI